MKVRNSMVDISKLDESTLENLKFEIGDRIGAYVPEDLLANSIIDAIIEDREEAFSDEKYTDEIFADTEYVYDCLSSEASDKTFSYEGDPSQADYDIRAKRIGKHEYEFILTVYVNLKGDHLHIVFNEDDIDIENPGKIKHLSVWELIESYSNVKAIEIVDAIDQINAFSENLSKYREELAALSDESQIYDYIESSIESEDLLRLLVAVWDKPHFANQSFSWVEDKWTEDFSGVIERYTN